MRWRTREPCSRRTHAPGSSRLQRYTAGGRWRWRAGHAEAGPLAGRRLRKTRTCPGCTPSWSPCSTSAGRRCEMAPLLTLEAPTITLRAYQEEAMARVLEAWTLSARRALVVLPTGMGKTLIFTSLLKRLDER